MSKHFFNASLSLALVGDPAVLVALEAGLVSDKLYGGQPYSRLTCLSPNAGGETVTITVPGVVPDITPAEVAQRVATLNFVRVKFIGLVCEIKGGEFNKVTFTGTAEKAEVVPPAAPGPSTSGPKS